MRINLLVLLLFAITVPAFGQRSPAWDPNVYLPHLGTPGEFDTVHVNVPEGQLQKVYNIGPEPGGSYGRIAITGLPSNPPFISVVEAGHSFDLKHLHVLKNLDFNFGEGVQRRAHLHNQRYSDFVVQVTGSRYDIYWQDEAGMTDSSRSTELATPWQPGIYSNLYVTKLVSDTVEDVFALANDLTEGNDTTYLLLWRGGESLYSKGGIAYPDSVLAIPPSADLSAHKLFRCFSQGDWRGVGRDDLIAGNDADHQPESWFYFRNDPPVSLGSILHSLTQDTLFAGWQNPRYEGGRYTMCNCLSFQALPHAAWDHAVDFVPSIPEDGLRNGSIYFFRGGPDFGTHRLYMDSAEAVIVNPAALDPAFEGMNFWGPGSMNLGDMTGTGRPVLGTGGSSFDAPFVFYYVLGNAIDTYADVFSSEDLGESLDTLTADADNREDQLIAHAYAPRLSLLHGSSRIPMRINPRYGVGAEASAEGVDVFPNPADRQFTITMHSRGGSGVCIIRNLLGQEVFRVPLQLLEGEADYRVQLPHLPSGEYMITIEATESSHHAKLTIVH